MPGVDIIAGLITVSPALNEGIALHVQVHHDIAQASCPSRTWLGRFILSKELTWRKTPPASPQAPIICSPHTCVHLQLRRPQIGTCAPAPRLQHMPNTPTPVSWLSARPFGRRFGSSGRSALGGVGVSRADAVPPDPESDFRTARRHASTDVSAVECLLDNADTVEGFQFEFRILEDKNERFQKSFELQCQRCNLLYNAMASVDSIWKVPWFPTLNQYNVQGLKNLSYDIKNWNWFSIRGRVYTS